MDDTGRDSISLLIRHNLGHGFPSSAPKSVFRLLNEWPHFPSSSNSSPGAVGRGVQVSNGNLSFFPVLVHLHIVTRASGGLVAWGEGWMQGGRTERANLPFLHGALGAVPTAGRTGCLQGVVCVLVSASRRDWAGLWQALLSPSPSLAMLCLQDASAAS